MGDVISLLGRKKPVDGIGDDARTLREMSKRVTGDETSHASAGGADDAFATVRDIHPQGAALRMFDDTLERLRHAYRKDTLPPSRLPSDAPELYAVLLDIRHHGGLPFGVEEQRELFRQFGSLRSAAQDLSDACDEILAILKQNGITDGSAVDHVDKLLGIVKKLDINDLAQVDRNREVLYLISLKVARMDLLLSGPEDAAETTTPLTEFGARIEELLPYVRLAKVSLAHLPEKSKQLVAICDQTERCLDECRTQSRGKLTEGARERLEVSVCAKLMELDLAIREALFQERNNVLEPRPSDAKAAISSGVFSAPLKSAAMLCASESPGCLPFVDTDAYAMSSSSVSLGNGMALHSCLASSATYALAGSMSAMVRII